MKIGIVYTGTTPELIDDVNKQIHKELGNNVELLTYGDVTILSDVITYGDVNSKPAAKLISLYSQAIMDVLFSRGDCRLHAELCGCCRSTYR